MEMPFSGEFVVERDPPPKRRRKTEGDKEKVLTEAAVMLAFAIHLFQAYPYLRHVELYPDGEHGKRFDIRGWLEQRGFVLEEGSGRTTYGGFYRRGQDSVRVTVKPGLGDVVADAGGETIIAECKGGVINTRHPGQKSRMRRGLCEAVGLLMGREPEGERHIAVVPNTPDTAKLADRLRKRCRTAGVHIALVDASGAVSFASE